MTRIDRQSPALAVFAGYDAGHYRLPQELLAARAALLRINTAARADLPPASEAEAVEELARQLATADTETDAAPVLDLRRQQESYLLRCAIYTRASGLAAGQLNQTAADLADVVITEHLAPVVAEVFAQVTKHAHTLEALDGADERALISASKPVRDAWLAVDELASTYAAARACRAHVLRLAGDVPEHDEAGLFGEISNPVEVWPEMVTSKRPLGQLVPPWPTDSTRARLLWYAGNGARPWCPTRQQQEAAWLTTFGDRLRQARTNQHNAAAWRAFGTSPAATAATTPAAQRGRGA